MLRPAAVVREEQQALAVQVEPADRIQAAAVRDERGRDEVEDGRVRVAVARRGRHAGRLVEQQVGRPRGGADRQAVDLDLRGRAGRPAGRSSPACRRRGRDRPRSGPRWPGATPRRRRPGPSGVAPAASAGLHGLRSASRRRRARRGASVARGRPDRLGRRAPPPRSGGPPPRRRAAAAPRGSSGRSARGTRSRCRTGTAGPATPTGPARRRAADGAASGSCSPSRRRGSAPRPTW